MILMNGLGMLTFSRLCFLACQIGIIIFQKQHLPQTIGTCREGSFVFIYIYPVFTSARPIVDTEQVNFFLEVIQDLVLAPSLIHPQSDLRTFPPPPWTSTFLFVQRGAWTRFFLSSLPDLIFNESVTIQYNLPHCCSFLPVLFWFTFNVGIRKF